MRQKRVCVAWVIFHFLLVTIISVRDTLWLVAHDLTIFPRWIAPVADKAGDFATAALAETLPATNPARQALATYLHLPGVERGYGYFAPNVPAAFKLVFELHHADGRVEYQLPRVHSHAAGLRLTGLLDEVARTESAPLREYLVKSLARPIWDEYPDVKTVRAIFGALIFPGPAEYARGVRESSKFLFAYDFSRVEDAAQPVENSLNTAVQRVSAFLFPAETGTWVSVLRIGLGAQTILYTLSLRQDWKLLFGEANEALVGRALAEKLLSLESPFVPRLSWLIDLGGFVGLGENAVLAIVWGILLCAGLGLLVGIFSRGCAVAAWFLHLCAAKSGGVLSYGVDNFMTIGLFYLMLVPGADIWSITQWWRKPRSQDRQVIGFFHRVLQIHLCVIYFFSGLTKCLGSGWWDGSNLWLALTRPPSNVLAPEMLVRWKELFPILGVSICVLEIGYAFLIWPKRTRAPWLIAVLMMHVAIGLTMRLYLFALVMIVLNLAAFGSEFVASLVSAGFRRITAWPAARQAER